MGCWCMVQGLQGKGWSLSQRPLAWLLAAPLVNVRALEGVLREGVQVVCGEPPMWALWRVPRG